MAVDRNKTEHSNGADEMYRDWPISWPDALYDSVFPPQKAIFSLNMGQIVPSLMQFQIYSFFGCLTAGVIWYHFIHLFLCLIAPQVLEPNRNEAVFENTMNFTGPADWPSGSDIIGSIRSQIISNIIT